MKEFKKRLLIGLCSWNNPPLLKICINSLIAVVDFSKDGIAVVLNEADKESINFLMEKKIPFVCLPENRGVLAIDYLIPFIQQSEYFLDTNDDMIFHRGFADDLIQIIEENYPASASCGLIENFFSNNPCVLVDKTLTDIFLEETTKKFIENFENGFYKTDHKIISYNHPICVKSKDFISVGGYSGNWNEKFYGGYGRDDMFAFELFNLYNGNFKLICSNKSFVFHASSATMRRVPYHIKIQGGEAPFQERTGLSIHQFRNLIKYGQKV